MDDNMKSINVKLSEEDYLKLKWVAERLGMGINETLRVLIPSIKFPESKVVKENEVAGAKFNDLVAILKLSDSDKKELEGILNQLFNAGKKRKGWAVTLAREIRQKLLYKDGEYLTVNTYKRLSRWIHPERLTEREKYVQKKAERISQLLFGHVINRID